MLVPGERARDQNICILFHHAGEFLQNFIQIKNMFKYFAAKNRIKIFIWKRQLLSIIKNVYLFIVMQMAFIIIVNPDILVDVK